MAAFLNAFYYGFVDAVTPFTYWGWKFIAGSVGVDIKRPWSAKICIYFLPVFLLILSPILALVALFTLSPLMALFILVFAPPMLSMTLVLWAVHLTFGPRALSWLRNRDGFSNRMNRVFNIAILVFWVGVIGLFLAWALWNLYEKVGWWTPLVLLGIVPGVVAVLAMIVGIIFLVHTLRRRFEWENERNWGVFTPVKWIFKSLWLILKFVFALLAMPFYLTYAAYKNFCPVVIYPASQTKGE